jgi:undecaprenyl-diphosphatase
MAGACTNGIDTGFVALGYAKVAVLGVVQGITELMPISSTAHMRIAPALFGWQDPGSAFSAAMQLAALAAVISYFWRDVHDLLFGSLSALGRRDFSDRSLKLAFGIAIGTISSVLRAPACTAPAHAIDPVDIIPMGRPLTARMRNLGDCLSEAVRLTFSQDWPVSRVPARMIETTT